MVRLLILTFLFSLYGCVQSEVRVDLNEDAINSLVSEVFAESSADGSGIVLNSQDTYTRSPDIELYAIQRDEAGNFLQNTAVQWSLDGSSGNLTVLAGGKHAVFSPLTDGLSKITMTANGATKEVLINVTDNTAPSFSFSTPTAAQDILLGNSFDLNFISSDPDDNANIDLYYSTSNAGVCSDGNYLTTLSEDDGDTSLAIDTNLIGAGTFYFCAVLTDIVDSTEVWSSNTLTVVSNSSPSLSFSTPTVSQQVFIGNAFDLNFTSSDSDDNATINLYYATSNSGNCSDGILLTTLNEDDGDTSFSVDTSSFAETNYYFCGTITDAYRTNEVWATHSLSAVANTVPTLSFSTPTSAQQVWIGNNFDLNFVSSDPDDNATINLYYASSNAGTCSDGTLITSLSENNGDTTFALDTTSIAAGTYYFCGTITDAVRTVTEWSTEALTLAENSLPTFAFTTPTDGDSVFIGNNFDLDFTVNDSDDNATVALYYSTNSSGSCNDQNFITSFSEDSGTSTFAFDTSVLSVDDYYFCATLTDAVRTITVWSTYSLSAISNALPTLAFSTPTTAQQVWIGNDFDLNFTSSDSDDNATINLYYATSNSGACNAGTLITSLNEDDGDTTYALDTTSIAAGTYYFCGTITDAVRTVEVWSAEALNLANNAVPTLAFSTPTAAQQVWVGNEFDLNFTSSDSDDNATINLYYATSNSGACNAGTLITSLNEDDGDTTYAVDTTSIAAGTYYFCGTITDAVRTVEVWSAEALTLADNAAPTLAFSTPTAAQQVWIGNDFDLNFTSSDSDDNATINLYYATSNSGACNAGTLITTLNEDAGDTTYAVDTNSIAAGLYYFCGTITDAVRTVEVWSAEALSIAENEVPTLSFSTPVVNDRILLGETFDINWTASDSDDNASISFYYALASGGNCSDGTLITSFNEDDGNTSYTFDTSAFPVDEYFFCAVLTDSLRSVDVWAANSLNIVTNTAPTISLDSPSSAISQAKEEILSIAWTDTDPDDDATVSLYHMTANSGDCTTDGTLITTVSEDDGTNAYDWTVPSSIASGTGYICASIDDGVNVAAQDFSAAITFAGRCEWLGTTSDTSDATNWANCGGGVPTQTDYLYFPNNGVSEPTVSSSLHAYGITTSSETPVFTINGGKLVRFYADYAIRSSVTFKGATDDCSNCYLWLNNTNHYITENATLRLEAGIKLRTGWTNLRFGDGVTAGHLEIVGGATEDLWPSTYVSNSAYGITSFKFNGSSSSKSSVSIDGFNYKTRPANSYTIGLHFVENYEIKKISNMNYLSQKQTRNSGNFMKFENCTSGTFTESTYDNINLKEPVDSSTGNNIYMDDTTCTSIPTAGNITLTNSLGAGRGSPFEYDSNSLVSWNESDTSYHCEWNGSTDSDWFNSANWSNCANGRGGYPTAHDNVFLQSTATYSPVVTVPIVVNSFSAPSADLGGGTITIGADSTISPIVTDITTNVSFVGETDDCSTCHFGAETMKVLNNATLTLGRGVTFRLNDGEPLYIGDGSSPGHLKIDTGSTTNQDYWTKFTPWSYYTGYIIVEGVDAADKSSIYIDGYYTTQFHGAGLVNLVNYYEVKKLDNARLENAFTFSHSYKASGTRIKVQNCANATFTDTSWDEIDFVTTPYDDFDARELYNVQFIDCSLQGTGSLDISPLTSGYNNGYGQGFADDPTAILNWN